MLDTPVKIRTLQRKLYAKAKQEPGYRFYALYDKVYRADILHHAYRLVRSNKGAPGIDGVCFADLEAEEGVEQWLAELAMEVKNKTYQAMPVRRGDDTQAVSSLWFVQTSIVRSLETSAYVGMKNIGKPSTEKPYARFDAGGQDNLFSTLPRLATPVSLAHDIFLS